MTPPSSRRTWALLLAVVGLETFATLMLKRADGFAHLLPAMVAFGAYGAVLFLFSYVLAAMPASVAYAVWTALGTLLVIGAGWIWFGEVLSPLHLAGVGMLVVGVILIHPPKADRD